VTAPARTFFEKRQSYLSQNNNRAATTILGKKPAPERTTGREEHPRGCSQTSGEEGNSLMGRPKPKEYLRARS